MAFNIQRFEARDRAIVSQLAQTDYPEVFADEPWNEWVKCNTESTLETEVYFGRSSGLNPNDPCPSCQTVLDRYYEFLPTYAKILTELGNAGTIALIGTIRRQIAGFAWSFYSNIETIATSKWKDNAVMQDRVVKALAQYVGRQGEIRYFSEVGVKKPYRNRGIGTALSREATRDNLPIVVRTNQNSPMTIICDNLGLVRVIGPKLQIQDNVRLDRVLYVSPRN